MKRCLFALVAALLLLPSVCSAADGNTDRAILADSAMLPPDPDFKARLDATRNIQLARDLQVHRRNHTLDAVRHRWKEYSPDLYDLQRVTGDVRLDPASQSINARIEWELTPVDYVGEEYVVLDRTANLNILLDGRSVAFQEIDYQGYPLVLIDFTPALQPGQNYVLTFDYSGTVDCTPTIIFEIPACIYTPDFTAFVANYWYPQGLSQRPLLFASEINLTYPAGPLAAVTGALIDETVNADSTVTRTYALEQYHSALSLTAADYSTFKAHSAGGVDIGVRMVSRLGSGEAWAARYAEILDDFSADYGPYPAPVFNASEVPDEVGAGLGYFAAIMIPSTSFSYGPNDPELGYNSIHAHETGHNWFPGLVPVSDDYAPWLSEGFAEFSAVQFSRASYEWYPGAYMRSLSQTLGILTRLYPQYNLALSGDEHIFDDDTAYFYTTYYKGAMVLLQLMGMVGEEPFFAAMRDYVADNLYEATDTMRFRGAMADALDPLREDFDMGRYFDEFVYGKGIPLYKVGVEVSKAEDGWETRVSLRQDGSSFYQPMELVVHAAKPEDSVAMNPVGAEGDVTFAHTFHTASEPGAVGLDPEWKAMKMVQSELPGDVNISGDVDGVDLLFYGYASGSSIFESSNYLADVDFDLNGVVDDADKQQLLANFGRRYQSGE